MTLPFPESKFFLQSSSDFNLLIVIVFLPTRQTQRLLQDPGAGEAPHGAQRLHDQPRPPGQHAEPRTHRLAQPPEAAHAQVGGGEQGAHTHKHTTANLQAHSETRLLLVKRFEAGKKEGNKLFVK